MCISFFAAGCCGGGGLRAGLIFFLAAGVGWAGWLAVVAE